MVYVDIKPGEFNQFEDQQVTDIDIVVRDESFPAITGGINTRWPVLYVVNHEFQPPLSPISFEHNILFELFAMVDAELRRKLLSLAQRQKEADQPCKIQKPLKCDTNQFGLTLDHPACHGFVEECSFFLCKQFQ